MSIQQGGLSDGLEVPSKLITCQVPHHWLQEQQSQAMGFLEGLLEVAVSNVKHYIHGAQIAGFLVTHTQSGEKFACLALVLLQLIHKYQVLGGHQACDNLCSCSSARWQVGTLVFGSSLWDGS